jgi:hypothetical protein
MSRNPVFADHPNLLRAVRISETKAHIAKHFHRLMLHHCEVGKHVRAANQRSEGAHSVGYATALFDDFFIGAGGFFVPLPGIFESVIWEAERVPSFSAKSTL